MQRTLYTIGHSTHSLARFLELLHGHEVAAVADVRSAPYSRRSPHFSRAKLEASLRESEVAYSFLGRELGGRPSDPACYREGRVDYGRMAVRPEFRSGLDRVEELAGSTRLALLCAEGDPLLCHRAILVARELARRAVAIRHVLPDGSIEPHEELEQRLLRTLRLGQGELFPPDPDRIERAYEIQGTRIGVAAGARASRRDRPRDSRS